MWRREVRATLRVGLPLAAAQLASVLMGLTDTLMMSLLGRDGLAGGALGAAIASLTVVIGGGFLSGIAPLAGQAHGASSAADTNRVLLHGLAIAAALSIPGVAFLAMVPSVLGALGEPSEAVEGARGYLFAFAPGLVAALSLHAIRQSLAVLGRPGIVLVTTLLGAALNAVGDYVFMRGSLGLPAMGLAGIGAGSTLANVTMLVVLATFLRRKGWLSRPFIFDGALSVRLLRLGAPVAMMFGLEIGLFTFTALNVGRMGSSWLAAHQIALQTTYLTYVVPHGFSQAAAARVAIHLGARDPAGARRAGITAIGFGGGFMSVVATVLILFPGAVVDLYGSAFRDPFLHSAAASLMVVAGLFQIFDGIQVTTAGALRGYHDTRVPSLIAVVTYALVGVPLSLIFGAHFGAQGYWIGLAAGLAASAMGLLARFAWRSRRLGLAA